MTGEKTRVVAQRPGDGHVSKHGRPKLVGDLACRIHTLADRLSEVLTGLGHIG